jgi:hypothetical protein
MVKRIFGLLLALWGGGIIIKDLFIHPTLITKFEFYGFTPFLAGNLIALIFGAFAFYFGSKLLFTKKYRADEKK